MIRHTIFGIAALAALATGASAAGTQGQFEMAPSVAAPSATALHLPPPPPPRRRNRDLRQHQPQAAAERVQLLLLLGVIGPDNTIGSHMLFDAMGFMPTTNLKVVEIDVAVSYNSGVKRILAGALQRQGRRAGHGAQGVVVHQPATAETPAASSPSPPSPAVSRSRPGSVTGWSCAPTMRASTRPSIGMRTSSTRRRISPSRNIAPTTSRARPARRPTSVGPPAR